MKIKYFFWDNFRSFKENEKLMEEREEIKKRDEGRRRGEEE